MRIFIKHKILFPAPLLATLIIPVGLFLILIPFSVLFGQNLIVVLLFWFILVPAISISLPFLVLKRAAHLVQSLIGLILFYLFMVWMIYDHYQTDFFRVMMFSCLFNIVLIAVIGLSKRLIKTGTGPSVS